MPCMIIFNDAIVTARISRNVSRSNLCNYSIARKLFVDLFTQVSLTIEYCQLDQSFSDFFTD